MNRKEYIENKKKIKDNSYQEREICYTCMKPKASCLCRHLKPFSTNTHFVILMHTKEARKERVGTGRLGHLILKNSKIIVGVDFTNDKLVNELLKDNCFYPMILYPGSDSFNVSKKPIVNILPKGKKLLIFIIDGTWFLAKKILRESKNLHNIPRISFETDKLSKFSIKQQPAEVCLSTIEAIHLLISELKKQNFEKLTNEHDNLTDTLAKLVEFQMNCASDGAIRGYRKRKFKNISERTPSLREKIRKVY